GGWGVETSGPRGAPRRARRGGAGAGGAPDDRGPGLAMWGLWGRHVTDRLLDRLVDRVRRGAAASVAYPHSPVVRQAGQPSVAAVPAEELSGVSGGSGLPGQPDRSDRSDRSDDEKASSC
ncbi:hypothetical protein ACFV23_55595, partial [Streptomyces sp. NPDC059627]